MSARNMAKRTAAGTLALAVCLGGGALAFAGAANADVTTAPATVNTPAAINIGSGDVSKTVADVVYDTSALVTDSTAAGNVVTFTLGGVGATGVSIAALPTVTLAGGVGAGSLTPTAFGSNAFRVTLPASHTAAAGSLTISGLKLAGGGTSATAGAITLAGVAAAGAGATFPVSTLGTANAYVTSTTTAASLDPTKSANWFVRAAAQPLDDVTVAMGTSSWANGDRYVFQLPAGVTFSSLPTVTPAKVSGSGTVAPTVSVTALSTSDDPSTSTGSDAVASTRQVAVTFTNTSGTSSADMATSWKLVFTGLKADVSSGFAASSISIGASNLGASATTATKGKIYREFIDNNSGTYNGAALNVQTGTAAGSEIPLSYFAPATVNIAKGSTFIVGGGLQQAPSVDVKETASTSIASGAHTLAIEFFDKNGNAVALDSSSLAIGGDSFAPTLTVNGTAVTSGTFAYVAGKLTLPSATFTSATDTVSVGNLRFTGLKNGGGDPVGPISAKLVDIDSSSPFTVINSVGGAFPTAANQIVINASTVRLGGSDRYETAAQVATQAFGGNYNAFVLASGEGSGVDALAANYVAGKLARPLVLTDGDALSPASLTYLKAHAPAVAGTVTFNIVGGPAAISAQVKADLDKAFPSTGGWNLVFKYYAGSDRYETAANAATGQGAPSTFSAKYGSPALKTAIIASGENSADAVVAGGVAFKAGFPLMLTKREFLPDATSDALDQLGVKRVILMGGTTAVSQGVEDKLKAAGIDVIRIGGAERFDTAVKLADFARTPQPNSTNTMGGLGYDGAAWTTNGQYSNSSQDVILGNGGSYADVLAAGQLSGGGTYKAVLTTASSGLSAATNAWIVANKGGTVTGLGGASVLPSSVLSAAQSSANN